MGRFNAARQGGAPQPPEWPAELGEDAAAVNVWMYHTYRDRPLAAVLSESRDVWQQLVEIVEALPEADLMGPGRFEWIGGRALGPANLTWSFEHLHEHAAQIDDWLVRRLSES
jgi:hypothetical protein